MVNPKLAGFTVHKSHLKNSFLFLSYNTRQLPPEKMKQKNSEAVSKNEMPKAIIAGISFIHTPPTPKRRVKIYMLKWHAHKLKNLLSVLC
jgi:hypothetical protein